jgi:hypothetical protein
MALVPFTGTVTQATLRANFDDKTSTLTTNALAGKTDHVVYVQRLALNTTDDISVRCVDFTPVDDYELRVLRLRLDDTVASRTVTATVTVTDGDTTFLLDKTISVTGTTIIGVSNAYLDLRTVTGNRLRLLKGVPYRLTIDAPSAGPLTSAMASIVLRSLRRPG